MMHYTSFAVFALLLASIGVQRTHEVGVRMALGAERRHVLGLFLWEGMLLLGAGVAIGLSGALLLTRFLRHILYDVSPTDLRTYLAQAPSIGTAALLATVIPARRAASSDPMIALRHE